MKNYLFIGGQHHGEMLPVREHGYREVAIRLMAGGVMKAFASERLLGTARHDFDRYLIDGLCSALDNCDRVLTHCRKHPRSLIPLNETLQDEPGQPAQLVPWMSEKRGEMCSDAGRH